MEMMLKRAKQHGLELREHTLQVNESGLDFLAATAEDVYGKMWLLRMPRRPDVLDGIEKERSMLAHIRQYAAFAVPNWEIVTDELIAYEALPGKPAGVIDKEAQAYVWNMDPERVTQNYEKSFAEAVASLHQIPKPEQRSMQEVRKTYLQQLEQVEKQFTTAPANSRRWCDWIEDDRYWPQETALTHGDLHAGHILIDADERVTGFIDWTEAAVHDPAQDFTAHYHTFGKASLERVLAHYERAGGYVSAWMLPHIEAIAGAGAIQVALFAIRSGESDYVEMAKTMLMNTDA
ncbi:macrolide 2'-phosphotransferase [Alkalicoccus luteus]|uniref:Phosphotransferase n=1 Tax=Alkalicoccus luteus TaxID=1237094 RepID=A0A969PWT1_9BACI|nr:macrolide 2'-phosphotransferase [Alkalicoccus luteus]NJP39318.1 phosphotransferase [Alkalicoccus luteus]